MNAQNAQLIIEWTDFILPAVALLITIFSSVAAATWVLSNKISSSFHSVELRVHGIETIVSPYGERMEKFDHSMHEIRDRLSKVEAVQITRDADIDRHERLIETVMSRNT